MFDKKKYVEIKTFRNEMASLKNQFVLLKTFKADIADIKKELLRKPSDDTNEARHALAKCTEYKNKCESREQTINILHTDIVKKSQNIEVLLEKIHENELNISTINKSSISMQSNIELLTEKIELLDSLFEGKEDLTDKLSELTSVYEEGSDLSNKIVAIYNSIKKKKDDIEALSYEIFGYEEENEENESEHINGLKDELEKSYTDIEKNFQTLQEALNTVGAQTNTKYKQFIKSKEEIYENLVSDIEKLLPKALTAGLSHAFSEKRKSEILDGKKLSRDFLSAIKGLVAISFIPFAVSTYLLFNGTSLLNVLNEIPRMVLSILPLYIPVIWLAYSSSKKMNLSKRLVEEYTHKEVLSKTFEGLSKQIENIEDTEISSELRTKLLYNILSVSSENPGKLISDYNTADHPLMDALDKSVKLSDAIDNISKIPGLSKLSQILEKKVETLHQVQEVKTEEGLSKIKNDNG